MALFKIPISNILGLSYYRYTITSTNYTPTPNSTITITCKVTNVFGREITDKEITLYKNGGMVSTQTTDSNGEATWTETCNTNGLIQYNIGNQNIEVFVDNTSKTGHTHTKSQITNFTHNHNWVNVKNTDGSSYSLNFYVNEQIGMCHLRLSITKTGGTANTFYGNDSNEWTALKNWIPSSYRPTYQAQGSMNYNGSYIVGTDGTIVARFGESWNGDRTLLGSVYWRYKL